MDNDLKLKGKRIRLFLTANGYKYHGTVLEETDDFLIIKDEKDHSQRIFQKNSISNLEVLA